MSQESTTPDLEELARRSNEAFDRGDFEAALAMYTPDAVWDMSSTGAGVFEGRDAIRSFWEDWFGAYQEWAHVIEEWHNLGNGVGFAVVIQKARPVGSGGEVRLSYAFVSVWVEGLIVLLTNYADIDEARAAAERLAEERE